MGDHAVREIGDVADRSRFTRYLIDDIDALDKLLDEGAFEEGVHRIGAEQEFCLVDRNWEPSDQADKVMSAVNDPHFTTELAKYNLEINLDPLKLEGSCFSTMEQQLRSYLEAAQEEAKKLDLKIVLTGILPTITPRHIELDQMTPSDRFAALDSAMRKQKGGDFELHIAGVDELITKHKSIVFEACNTSFQMHLQISPKDSVDLYNWSQLIAAPVMAVSANSPLLLGKELWSETRIALFQQSIDVRNSSTLIREKQPRVAFGSRWLREKVTEVLKEDVARYELILGADMEGPTALEKLEQGATPDLRALSVHNGTVYRWNRLCYGMGPTPHLRIECRYVPSGPTILDEMANKVFWVGLMRGMQEEHRKLWEKMPFRQAKANFFRAAISGLETKLNWFGKVYDTRELIEHELLPLAQQGLQGSGIDRDDIRKYLGVIRQRLSSHNGAQWMTHAYRALSVGHQNDIALRRTTALMHRAQTSGEPVGEWEAASTDQLTGDELALEKVYQVMITDLLTVRPTALVDLARHIMAWKGIEQIPVEDEQGAPVGLITKRDLLKAEVEHGEIGDMAVAQVMKKELFTAGPNDPIQEVRKEMIKQGYGCVPVVYEGKLVGLVTKKHLERLS